MKIDISKIIKLAILIIFSLFYSLFLNPTLVKAQDEPTCGGVVCVVGMSYCLCTEYYYPIWSESLNDYLSVYGGTVCGCTKLNSPIFTCDGIWGACDIYYNGTCWQTRGCSDGSTQIRSCGSCSGVPTGAPGPTGAPVITPTPFPVCNVGLSLNPSSKTIYLGENFKLTATTSNTTATCYVDYVYFQTLNGLIAVANPVTDVSVPYETTIYGVGVGSTQIRAFAVQEITILASASMNVDVEVNPGPWWQVRDGDITAKGSVGSNIKLGALNPFLILPGLGGYPGIVTYENLLYTGQGEVSEKNWQADLYSAGTNTGLSSSNIPSLALFKRSVDSEALMEIESSDISGDYFSDGETLFDNAYWYYYDGRENGIDLTINSDINIGTKKIVLFVEGADLNINGKINLTKGEGFFMVIVGKNSELSKGNINIDPSVIGSFDNIPEIEGIYFAEGTFSTGTGSSPLHIRGSVAALESINLERDLGDIINLTSPAELFEFAPDQLLLMPNSLKTRKINWKEVSP